MEPDDLLCEWSARKLRPVVLLYVTLVFVVFMGVAHFVVHSSVAVKALALAIIGAVVPLVPAVTSRFEFRLTARGLERRVLDRKKPKEFETLFRLDQLSHIVRTRHGFKYYKQLDEWNPWRRFWKLHVSDAHSGEVQVETTDQPRVLDMLAGRGLSIR